MSSTTTTETIKTLKTTATAEATKTIKTTIRTVARGEVTEDEAADIAAGSMRMSTRTVAGTMTTEKPTTTTTFGTRHGLADRYFYLLDITHSERDKVRMEENLVEHVKDTICILERKFDKKIELMYIGKTHADEQNGETFDRLDHNTWTPTGINNRWNKHKRRPEIPTDGMVVLCAFTEDDLPAGSRRSHEFLALAMEQRLIHHFQIFDTDKIAVNKTFDAGNPTAHTKDSTRDLSSSIASDISDLDLTCDPTPPEPTHYASVLYMTFAYITEEEIKRRKLEEEKVKKMKKKAEEQKKAEEKKQMEAKRNEAVETFRQLPFSHSSEKESETEEKSVLEASLTTKSAKEESASLPMSAFSENGYPRFSSTPISSPKESISSPTTSALSSKENIPPLSTSSPLSTVRKDLLPALEETLELLQTTQ